MGPPCAPGVLLEKMSAHLIVWEPEARKKRSRTIFPELSSDSVLTPASDKSHRNQAYTRVRLGSRGTVVPLQEIRMSTPWSQRYAFRTAKVKSSAIRELLKLTQRPEIISFAGGLPAGELFPTERFAEACRKVLLEKAQIALQYGPTEGYGPLREMIAQNLNRYGIPASAENVLVTSGSQQALDLIAKLLINRGDQVLTEAPTYLGALQAFNVFGARYVTVPIDDDGIRTDLLEEALRTGP